MNRNLNTAADKKRDSEIVDMNETQFQNYRRSVHKQSLAANTSNGQQHVQQFNANNLDFDFGVNDITKPQSFQQPPSMMDQQSLNPMFSLKTKPAKQMRSDYNPVPDLSPKNSIEQHTTYPSHNDPQTFDEVPMIRKRKKRKMRDANGKVMYDEHGNVIYEYKFFMVPDPNYNPQQPGQQYEPGHNETNEYEQQQYDEQYGSYDDHQYQQQQQPQHDDDENGTYGNQNVSEYDEQTEFSPNLVYSDSESHDDYAGSMPQPSDIAISAPPNTNRNDRGSSIKSDDAMSLPEDMPPAPPPNLREKMSKESNDFEARKSRKSQQFGFRRSSEKPKSPSVSMTVPSFKNQKRNSLAIRVRSGSGTEETLVNYIAPTTDEDDEEDVSGQDNVNPLAFGMQQPKEQKRKKKKKQNTLSTTWNSREEKRLKKRLRKQRKQRLAAMKQQEEVQRDLGGIKEEENEVAEDAFGGNVPAPPTSAPPKIAQDIPQPPVVTLSEILPGPPKKRESKSAQIKFSVMEETDVEKEEEEEEPLEVQQSGVDMDENEEDEHKAELLVCDDSLFVDWFV